MVGLFRQMGKLLVLILFVSLHSILHETQGKIDTDFLSSAADQQLIRDSITDEFLSQIGTEDDGGEAYGHYGQGGNRAALEDEPGLMTVPTLKEWIKLDFEVYMNLTTAATKNGELTTGTERGSEAELVDTSIQDYISDYEELSESISKIKRIGKIDSRVEAISWNMLAIYRVVRRLYLYLPDIFENQEPKFQETIRHIQDAYSMVGGPRLKDFEDSMLAIVNVHFLYDLQASNIAAGYVRGKYLGVELNAYHCYEIGNEAMSKHFFTSGIEWLEHALSLAGEDDSFIDPAIVQDSLEDSVQYHDEEFENAEGYEPYFFTESLSVERHPEKRQTQKKNQYEGFKTKQEPNFSEINYWGVCSGKPHQTEALRSQLFCWYESQVHPWYRFGPLKAEVLSLTPIEVVQYYDVISDRVAEALKVQASPNLERSTTFSDDNSGPQMNSKLRLSSTFWFNGSSKEEAHITKIVESITGLNASGGVEHGDYLQVAAYSPGGHYVSHVDAQPIEETNEAHRIATFMFYLSDVPNGGETAFVQAGVRARPAKRSAVFWYNVYSDSEVNQLTWHGACPVLYGEKWVANKWIVHEHQNGILQCHLQRKSQVNILVSGKVWNRKTRALQNPQQ